MEEDYGEEQEQLDQIEVQYVNLLHMLKEIEVAAVEHQFLDYIQILVAFENIMGVKGLQLEPDLGEIVEIKINLLDEVDQSGRVFKYRVWQELKNFDSILEQVDREL